MVHDFISRVFRAEIQADKRSPDSGHFCVGQSRKSVAGKLLARFAGFHVLNLGLQWKCIIEGPAGTPYEGGNFMFELTFPPEYPFHSPKCVLMDCCCSVERDQLTRAFAVKSLTKVRKSRASMKLPCRHTDQLNVRLCFTDFAPQRQSKRRNLRHVVRNGSKMEPPNIGHALLIQQNPLMPYFYYDIKPNLFSIYSIRIYNCLGNQRFKEHSAAVGVSQLRCSCSCVLIFLLLFTPLSTGTNLRANISGPL